MFSSRAASTAARRALLKAAAPSNRAIVTAAAKSTVTLPELSVSPASTQCRFVHVEQRMRDLGITLPKAAGPRANYDVVCEDDRVLYVSGHIPFRPDGTLVTGKLTGEDGLGVEHGYQAARHVALNIVATLSERLGDLDRIEKIQKVFGIVQSSSDFHDQHLVMDGCSDLLMEVFGKEVGYHARSAIGTSTLPLNITVEIEAIVKVRPARTLRFEVGQRVECNVGRWEKGVITQLHYREPGVKGDQPYQIRLDSGSFIYAPEDNDSFIRAIVREQKEH